MRIGRIIFWVYLLAAGLMTTLTPSGLLLAQGDKVELTLRLFPEYYYSKVVPGEDNTLYVEVKNNGTRAVTSIRFDAKRPEGWVVEFRPASLDYLGVGSTYTVDVRIVPTRGTGRGEYSVTLIAEANETRSVTSTVLRVESSTSFWLWIGAGVAALVVAAFVFIFLRFGRQ